MPFFSAYVSDFCVVGPSAIESVKGRACSSISMEPLVIAGHEQWHVRTGTTGLHSQQDVYRFISSGKACSNVGNKSWAMFTLALGKCLFDVLDGSGRRSSNETNIRKSDVYKDDKGGDYDSKT